MKWTILDGGWGGGEGLWGGGHPKFCRVESFIILKLIEFSLNVFIEFLEFSDKNVWHYSKRARTCQSATSFVRDQHATPAPARQMWEPGSLNWAQFMLQWLTRFPEFAEFSEFLFHLGKTPIYHSLTSGWSKGGTPARLPTDKNVLNFIQFLGKSGKFVCWRPLLEGWRPLLRGILDPPLLTSDLLCGKICINITVKNWNITWF